MKQFNINAIGLTIKFSCQSNGEYVAFEIDSIPSPNYFADSIRDSENSSEEEFVPFEDGDTYVVRIYVNTAEGNVELINLSTDENIDDYIIEEHLENE